MEVQYIPFKETGYFSNLICDYLDKHKRLSEFYGNHPDIEGFRNQIELKKTSFSNQSRSILTIALKNQYKSTKSSELTSSNIILLESENTFTITTGHQLNIFTGPLYFLYKIVSAINTAKFLKSNFPRYDFVPLYWMATEDHDFEEINFFNFKNQKIKWNKKSNGAVGRLPLSNFESIFEEFSTLLNESDDAIYLKELFKKAYFSHSNLADATRYLVNELFGDYGLVIIDGDDSNLKQQFIPIVKDELHNNTSYKCVSNVNEKLAKQYKIQVNPREINLFYLDDQLRERIIYENERFVVHNTSISFSKTEILKELENFPEKFSPNVIMRPVYQEFILPNLCYIGGGGEIAYWLQLKEYFDVVQIPFPILLLRNSALFVSVKQVEKATKLGVTILDLFNNQNTLITKKIKEQSDIKIDFSEQKAHLIVQFKQLKELAIKTDKSFLGAVNAQEKKQLNGLNMLEKKLLRAQKRKMIEYVDRLSNLQNELFPKQSLEERYRNFSEVYEKIGLTMIPDLVTSLNPLHQEFHILNY
ncbi:bacillithiol biosynthesis cysteine-adding enzyme BshC [Lutibacter sp.]|uniref:bacillithiol biosynthesis cysteine-adding enzyme BshC n=1 Tax=Lutibacter sp. TaxID=1925666 RepID=UPI00273717E8|nr:bacillithiol biosynthesis cysteine-adding enzyme BshC [Lutibacter sp.]MDP3313509.1 bacillithiol biosynthesis cysteine-adding enzyme BshC [Lutibacter sp.]